MEQEDQTQQQTPVTNVSDHLANERTFLAWMRTSIALMGFGFVVVKFSLFIRQLSFAVTDKQLQPSRGFSSAIGILLVAIGALVALAGYIRYRHIGRQLLNKSFYPSFRLSLLVTVAILFMSALLLGYLMANA